MNTPVLFLVFNRPDTTEKVFERVRKARPADLFIAMDGPRAGNENDIKKCAAVKDIVSRVDWPCKVSTLFREKNLGCRKAVSSAITWFFENVEEGIILEDDCLPEDSFFTYCVQMLEKYRNDTRIGMISGCNFGLGRGRDNFSYCFSRYNYIWGWASWRRAWKNYDVKMGLWPEVKAGNRLNDIFEKSKYVKYWTEKFDATYDGVINTWDYQWFFACLVNNFLSIIPGVNLVSNIGFSSEATHTAGNPNDAAANIQTFPMKFPINHPPFIIRNSELDTFVQNNFFVKPGVLKVLNHNIKMSVKKMLNIKK